MSDRFEIASTPIAGLELIQRRPRADSRGFFERLFCAEELRPLMNGKPIAQINHTLTVVKGTVRGLHFQLPPHAEIKIVGCLRGEIFDVAVDLRRGSPTFLRWHAERLSADNHRSMLIPEGFAHGFQTLAGDCELIYLHSAAYASGSESGLNVRDPRLAIDWPEPIAGQSERDAGWAIIANGFSGIAT